MRITRIATSPVSNDSYCCNYIFYHKTRFFFTISVFMKCLVIVSSSACADQGSSIAIFTLPKQILVFSVLNLITYLFSNL